MELARRAVRPLRSGARHRTGNFPFRPAHRRGESGRAGAGGTLSAKASDPTMPELSRFFGISIRMLYSDHAGGALSCDRWRVRDAEEQQSSRPLKDEKTRRSET